MISFIRGDFCDQLPPKFFTRELASTDWDIDMDCQLIHYFLSMESIELIIGAVNYWGSTLPSLSNFILDLVFETDHPAHSLKTELQYVPCVVQIHVII